MKWDKVVELGRACGLSTPEEFAENIELHAYSLFERDAIAEEITEMYLDAAELGIEFPPIPRELHPCDACGGFTYHRMGKCLRCTYIQAMENGLDELEAWWSDAPLTKNSIAGDRHAEIEALMQELSSSEDRHDDWGLNAYRISLLTQLSCDNCGAPVHKGSMGAGEHLTFCDACYKTKVYHPVSCVRCGEEDKYDTWGNSGFCPECLDALARGEEM